MTDRELMQQALYYMDDGCGKYSDDYRKLIDALRVRLAQPEPEPVWVEVTTNTGDKFILDSAVEADKIRAAKNVGLSVVPLYTKEQMKDIAQKLADCAVLNSAPPQREWQDLTDDESDEIWGECLGVFDCLKMTQAKLKEKNS